MGVRTLVDDLRVVVRVAAWAAVYVGVVTVVAIIVAGGDVRGVRQRQGNSMRRMRMMVGWVMLRKIGQSAL